MQESFKVIEPKTQLKKIPFSQNRIFITQKYDTEFLTYPEQKLCPLVHNNINFSELKLKD